MGPHPASNISQGDYLLLLAKHVKDFEQGDALSDALYGLCDDLCTKLSIQDLNEMQFRQLISSLSKIISLAENNTALAWTCVSVIGKISDSSVGKKVGILHRLTPVVAKLMPYACTEEKKLRLLNVLQKLTYGIVIEREETYLGPLFSGLINSIRTEKGSIVQLCLSVLTNLIHQNKKALQTLMQIVNLKELLEYILCLRCNIPCRMEVCKLMFLLEELMFEKPDDAEVINFVKVTFCTVIDACASGNVSALNHSISFFDDMVSEKKIKQEILINNSFVESTSKIINQLDSVDSECGNLCFRFLGILVKIGGATYFDHYPKILLQGVAWVSQHKFNAAEAIKTMHLILISHLCRDLSAISAENLKEVLLPLLNGHNYSFQSSLLHFLKALLDADILKSAFKEHLTQQMIEKFLESELDLNNYVDCEPAVEMYVQLLDFVNKVVTSCNPSWMTFYISLFRQPIVVSVLAVALLNGTSDLRAKVLSLICSVGFPGESITILAKAMASLTDNRDRFSAQFVQQSELNWKTSIEINKLIASIQDLVKNNKLHDISLTHVINLFECKEEVTLRYQKSLLESLSKATEEKSLLQDNLCFTKEIISELRKELSSIKPAFNSVQEKYDFSLKTVADQEDELRKLKCKLDEQITSCQKTICSLNERIEHKDRRIQEHAEKINVLKAELHDKTIKYASIEQSLQEKNDQNNSLEKMIEDLVAQGKEKETKVETLTAKVSGLSGEVATLESDLQNKIKLLKQLRSEERRVGKECQP